jgi:hypothetical protein
MRKSRFIETQTIEVIKEQEAGNGTGSSARKGSR